MCVALNAWKERPAQWGIRAATEHLLPPAPRGTGIIRAVGDPSLLCGDCSREDEQACPIVAQLPGMVPALKPRSPPTVREFVPILVLGLAWGARASRKKAQVGPPPVLEQKKAV